MRNKKEEHLFSFTIFFISLVLKKNNRFIFVLYVCTYRSVDVCCFCVSLVLTLIPIITVIKCLFVV